MVISQMSCINLRSFHAPQTLKSPQRHQASQSYKRKGCTVRCSSGNDHTIGVVVVDHGSRKAESNNMLFEFADLYRSISGRSIVQVAHMELAEPTIQQAVDACVAAGASKVIVAPYFLSRGRHIQDDIPALVAVAQENLNMQNKKVDVVIADPIGIDPLMAQLIENRVVQASGEVIESSSWNGVAAL